MLEKLWMVLKLGAMSLVWMLATVMVDLWVAVLACPLEMRWDLMFV